MTASPAVMLRPTASTTVASHERIIHHSGNAYLVEAYDRIAFRVQALRNKLSQDPALNQRSLGEHPELHRPDRRGR